MTCSPKSLMVSIMRAPSTAPPQATKTTYSTPVSSRSLATCSPTSSGVPTSIAPAATACSSVLGTGDLASCQRISALLTSSAGT